MSVQIYTDLSALSDVSVYLSRNMCVCIKETIGTNSILVEIIG